MLRWSPCLALFFINRESFTIGFLLNTKGLVELVVLNVGLDIGVLTSQVFAIFMIMALWYVFPRPSPAEPPNLADATRRNTFLTTPAVWLLWTRWGKQHNPKRVKR